MWRPIRFLALVLALTLLLTPRLALALEGPGPGLTAPGVSAAKEGSSPTDLLRDLNQALKSENESLKSLNAILKAENEALKRENALLRSQLEAAQNNLQELEDRVAAVAPATVPELVRELRSRVFRLDVYDYGGRRIGVGSAVAVTASDVVTNFHVVENAWSAQLVTETGARYPVLGMTAFDQAHDLALLRVNVPLEPVKLRTTSVETGEEVVAIGSPGGLTNTVSTGIVSSLRLANGRELIQVSAPISKGSSGGGLFDRQGNLVGITCALVESGQNLNFAVPARYVQQLLAQVGPVQDLPGASRVMPENRVGVLQEAYPVLEMNGQQVRLERRLVPNLKVRSWDTCDAVVIWMDPTAFYNLVKGMVAGDIRRTWPMCRISSWM